jgi:hypothetical protein
VDADSAAIQTDESPETTLDRTKHLLARSRRTLDDATRRLNRRDDDQDVSSRRSGDSLS